MATTPPASDFAHWLRSTGTQMGTLIAARDWSVSPLGPLEGWPGSLRTALGLVIGSPVPMALLWGASGVVLYNDAAAAFAGERHPALLGWPLRDGWPELSGLGEEILRAGLGGSARSFNDQALTLRRAGIPEEVWVSLDGSPVPGEAGSPAGVLVVLVETTAPVQTERRRAAAEDELRQQEERLRLVIEGAADYAILTTDRSRRVTTWSAGAQATFGYAPEEIIGQPFDVLFTPEDRANGVPEREAATALREGLAPDVRWHLRQDGSRVFVNGSLRPLRDGAGRELGFLKVVRDETERQRVEETARETTERYRLAARATNDAIWDWHFATNHVLWNEALEVAYGHRLVDVEPSGEWWLAQIHPEDRARVENGIHAVIDDGDATWTDEYRFRRADGTYADVLDRGHVIRDGAGRAQRMIGAMLDLTERRRSQAALRDSEERLRLATEAAEVGFWDVDVVHDVLIWPPRVKAMFGISPDVAVSMADFYEGLHPEDRERTAEAFAAAADPARRALYDVEYRTVGKEDGVIRWVAAKGRGLFDAEGRCVRVIGAALDITARKRAEERLRELNDRLEAAVAQRTAERNRVWEMSRDLLAVMGFDGFLKAINPAWETTLGFDAATLLRRPFGEQVHPEDHDAARAIMARLRDGEAVDRFEDRLRHADGSWRWISWGLVPEGDVFYAVGRDVTEERRRQAELEAAQEQLRQSQKMEAVGQLTGGLAHDFNNLLTGITGSLEMLSARIAQGRVGEVERYVTAAQGAAKRAAALTHRLLAFSRRQTLDPRPTDANRLVAGMEELIRRTVGPEVEVEVVAAGGLWPTLVDPNQLENAILNLALNARDAMPRGGRLTIETGNRWLDARAARARDLDPGQYVSVCVSDTGTGMTPEVAARAFDPFFTTKPLGVGTGLGLSMIYGFARQSGGQSRIYSELGRGTMVCLYLPRHLGPTDEAEEMPDLSDAPRAGAGETVLVVDDEPTVRMLVVEVLEDLGYAAVEAADGAAGLRTLQSDARVDLLVTDVGLPGGMNGRQVADAARALRPELKVLFITGYAENAVVSNGHLEPGMHVMTKPFAMEALATRIKDLIATGRDG